MKTAIYILATIATLATTYQIGRQSKQAEIEDRTKEMPTNNINESQLEYIIFGEIQL